MVVTQVRILSVKMSTGDLTGGNGWQEPPPPDTATPSVSQPANEMGQFAIPKLLPNQRLEDWEPLFRASVTGLLMRTDGEKLAIGLLAAHVNRREAEVELMKDVVKLDQLNEAFDLLKTLDDPIDKFWEMQRLCKTEWLRGTKIDDLFYKLKRQAKLAEAPLNLVCSIIIGQLPRQIQGKVKERYSNRADESSVSEKEARDLLLKIKELLKERGIPLDVGCTHRDELQGETSKAIAAIKQNAEAVQGEDSEAEVKAMYQGRFRGNNRRGGGRSNYFKNCFVCNEGGHISKECTNQYCQKCGKWGHGKNKCESRSVRAINAQIEGDGEETVTINVSLDGKHSTASLDSCASLSVIDLKTVRELGVEEKLRIK